MNGIELALVFLVSGVISLLLSSKFRKTHRDDWGLSLFTSGLFLIFGAVISFLFSLAGMG